MTKTEALIQQLQLEAHVEGGFFRRTYESGERPLLDTAYGPRLRLTSILYLLTRTAPIGRWHLNRSDILHFYHLGEPIRYYLIDDCGQLSTHTLGPDPSQGHQLQLVVPGGVWKASHLPHGDYGLISEAVCPGFEFDDMSLGARAQLLHRFPQHAALIEQFTP
ncbi:cupin domain-containing protein [Aestuariicella hydrocarbonica]|uniref:Cupin domain-containing protein n=1 Tax=Pseudomaricurvus hydrocarbonicus TaxID=1470433 RepID=A0A9E5MNT9_9GAMM|nr:cupin domain-containing protein [Aestuariicella hydrocarbonica]NHO67612.1 cupin domain-containing protein [Aestuariicella hydrocarbonica]